MVHVLLLAPLRHVKTCMKIRKKHSGLSANIPKDIIQYYFHIHLGFKYIQLERKNF